MTEEVKELLRRGGKCTLEDLDLLLEELPHQVDEDLGSDEYAGHIAYRTRFWFYIPEVRGYCVIYMQYELYEPEFHSPDLEYNIQYLKKKNEQEAFAFLFYDLSRQKSFSSYEELERHFIAAGGHQGADLKKDPAFRKLYDKASFDREDYGALFAYRNYVVSRPGDKDEHTALYRVKEGVPFLWTKEGTAVIWINEREHCTIQASYYLDEIKRMKLEITGAEVTFYLDGAPVRRVYASE